MSETILVVDDDESLRRMMEYTLQEAGYTVTVASDGGAVCRHSPRLRQRLSPRKIA